MVLLKTKPYSKNTQSRMALSSRGALEKFKTTGVPLKPVTAPSRALIWTLTKADFAISGSCRLTTERAVSDANLQPDWLQN